MKYDESIINALDTIEYQCNEIEKFCKKELDLVLGKYQAVDVMTTFACDYIGATANFGDRIKIEAQGARTCLRRTAEMLTKCLPNEAEIEEQSKPQPPELYANK